ncbi:hypothetical protein ASPZODRAFT_99088 [Penicilliopsis zonata CBS 506.65]|uniref:Glycoside hydrolase 131 catalytic N-terminal domain-containing protein n=1 Tax=Penicilliopsis zonata CBS 506.65 TaxID=1073090 RepID=A0A1L9SDD7_9EURO|nr:hypothetical protein ASPZODRAFT_99088 [Penicilliopsis zonata CBS 506.65]OJJ45230.1 hypothetical protein ASPZODRAFT_99088 [Penicilliopsis zonata CBS 506.65]
MRLCFLFVSPCLAGSVLWSGIFNSTATVEDFDLWSWSNEIEPWQWYIHGTGNTSEYLGLSADYKNPAASDAQGLRITIDGTSFWEDQTMERSELIPQTAEDLGAGHLYYHFSLSTATTNAPNASFEHQIAFFESAFTELQYGLEDGASGTSDNTLRWLAGGETYWSVQLEAGNWYNFAYDINFDNQTVGLWASNNSDPLVLVVDAVAVTASSNSEDWHVGELRLPNGGVNSAAEDWFWSGIYIEEAPLNTEIGSASAAASTTAASASTASTSSATSVATSTSTTAPTTSTTSTTSVSSTTIPVSTEPASTSVPTSVSTSVPSAVSSSTTVAEISTTVVSTSESSAVATATPTEVSVSTSTEVSVATPTAVSISTATASSSTATSTASTSTVLPIPSGSASQILSELHAMLTSLLSRAGVHARDFNGH